MKLMIVPVSVQFSLQMFAPSPKEVLGCVLIK